MHAWKRCKTDYSLVVCGKTWRFVFPLVKYGFGKNCLAVIFCTVSCFQPNASRLQSFLAATFHHCKNS